MHPRQEDLAKQASSIAERLAAGKNQQAGGPAVLWKYVDPDGNEFWLKVKRMTVKSPFSGKSFPARPVREPPSEVGKELREESTSGPPAGAGPGSKTQTRRKKKADEALQWKATSFEQPAEEAVKTASESGQSISYR